ncbi:MAG: phosphoribosylaminoimidazolesuccinocarboxamide synthase [Microthrixaceae bacterium]
MSTRGLAGTSAETPPPRQVRDLYALGEDRLVMVATDRLSALDVVMAEPVPDKGRVLTAMSAHWFAALSDVVDNHLLSTDVADLPVDARSPCWRAD